MLMIIILLTVLILLATSFNFCWRHGRRKIRKFCFCCINALCHTFWPQDEVFYITAALTSSSRLFTYLLSSNRVFY